MSVAFQVLNRASARIGYYAPNDPERGSESGRYWAARGKGEWLAGASTSIWWCMLFVSMVLDECGQMASIGGFSYNTDVTIRQARAAGCQFVSAANAKPGDVIIFEFNGKAGTDHVGFVEKNLGGGRLQTIEGNTSSGNGGSQSAGNGVWRRVRSSNIHSIIRPKYTGTANVATGASQTGWYLDPDGVWGPHTAKRSRSVFSEASDAPWSNVVKKLQVFLNWALDAYEIKKAIGDEKLEVDGVDGTKTITLFQVWWNQSSIPIGKKIPITGHWDFETVRAWQHTMNHSWANTNALARAR